MFDVCNSNVGDWRFYEKLYGCEIYVVHVLKIKLAIFTLVYKDTHKEIIIDLHITLTGQSNLKKTGQSDLSEIALCQLFCSVLHCFVLSPCRTFSPICIRSDTSRTRYPTWTGTNVPEVLDHIDPWV